MKNQWPGFSGISHLFPVISREFPLNIFHFGGSSHKFLFTPIQRIQPRFVGSTGRQPSGIVIFLLPLKHPNASWSFASGHRSPTWISSTSWIRGLVSSTCAGRWWAWFGVQTQKLIVFTAWYFQTMFAYRILSVAFTFEWGRWNEPACEQHMRQTLACTPWVGGNSCEPTWTNQSRHTLGYQWIYRKCPRDNKTILHNTSKQLRKCVDFRNLGP